jgi:hypothetical protein
MFGQTIGYFTVPRYRLRNISFRILVPIVSAAVADEYTLHITQFLDELDPFHPTTSSPDLRTCGISPEFRSS